MHARGTRASVRACMYMYMYVYVYACVCMRTRALRGVGLQTRPSVRKRQSAWRARGKAAGGLRGRHRGRASGGKEEKLQTRPLQNKSLLNKLTKLKTMTNYETNY
jgi:hypothetical protein